MEDFLSSLGERVRSLRKVRGYSQSELAERADLHTTYVSDIERGTARKVSAEGLYRISQSLGIEMSDLFASGPGDSEVENMTTQCFADLRVLPDERRRFILETVRKMLDEIDNV